MISPSENQKFAIPLVAEKVGCDSDGNYVPNVVRDKRDRIINATGAIYGGQLPKGHPPSNMIQQLLFKKEFTLQQIIPACWGGSGTHPDNLALPSHKQMKTKAKSPSSLDLEISEHLSKPGNKIVFCYDFRYEKNDCFPCQRRRYIDVIHENGHAVFFRNGTEYKLADDLKQ